ncbi:30S ribosomal protein S3 chloroplastic, partial [Bienertia sinuspersici]
LDKGLGRSHLIYWSTTINLRFWLRSSPDIVKINIVITRIEKPYGHPNILGEFIARQLKNRVSFRKAMKKAIELTEQADTKGIQIQIAGRIDGKEITHIEWTREGRVPLQNIRAKIDYCANTFRTIYGVLGIKIWIFIDEE